MKKLAKIFLTGMYLHLVLSIAVPVGMLYFGDGGWNVTVVGLFAFYLAMAALVHIAGWGCVVAAVTAYRRNEADKLRQSWKWLKLWSIPFYVLNFLYSFFVWFVLVGASRGIMIVLVPIPVIFTCLLIVQSGCVGICYIMLLRKECRKPPSGVYYVLQLLSVIDIFDTIFVLKNYREERS